MLSLKPPPSLPTSLGLPGDFVSSIPSTSHSHPKAWFASTAEASSSGITPNHHSVWPLLDLPTFAFGDIPSTNLPAFMPAMNLPAFAFPAAPYAFNSPALSSLSLFSQVSDSPPTPPAPAISLSTSAAASPLSDSSSQPLHLVHTSPTSSPSPPHPAANPLQLGGPSAPATNGTTDPYLKLLSNAYDLGRVFYHDEPRAYTAPPNFEVRIDDIRALCVGSTRTVYQVSLSAAQRQF